MQVLQRKIIIFNAVVRVLTGHADNTQALLEVLAYKSVKPMADMSHS